MVVEYWLRLSIVTDHWPNRKLGNAAASLEPYFASLLYELKKSTLLLYLQHASVQRHL